MKPSGAWPEATCCAIQSATWAASRSALPSSSGSTRGWFRLSRQTGSSSLLASSFAGRSMAGKAPTEPASWLCVVWGRKPAYSPAVIAAAMAVLSVCTTACEQRRVWSQLSSAPPSPCTTKAWAALNTWGSARRKR